MDRWQVARFGKRSVIRKYFKQAITANSHEAKQDETSETVQIQQSKPV
jgi:hypothetical protein